MPRSTAIRLVSRSARKLNEPFVERLALALCAPGDDPKGKAEALLVLIDELEKSEAVDGILMAVKSIAFRRLGEEDRQLMDATVQLLRGEFGS